MLGGGQDSPTLRGQYSRVVDKGAIEFAELGYDVKEMIGGYEYWVREGQPTENDEGPLPRVFDAQVMAVRVPSAS